MTNPKMTCIKGRTPGASYLLMQRRQVSTNDAPAKPAIRVRSALLVTSSLRAIRQANTAIAAIRGATGFLF